MARLVGEAAPDGVRVPASRRRGRARRAPVPSAGVRSAPLPRPDPHTALVQGVASNVGGSRGTQPFLLRRVAHAGERVRGQLGVLAVAGSALRRRRIPGARPPLGPRHRHRGTSRSQGKPFGNIADRGVPLRVLIFRGGTLCQDPDLFCHPCQDPDLI